VKLGEPCDIARLRTPIERPCTRNGTTMLDVMERVFGTKLMNVVESTSPNSSGRPVASTRPATDSPTLIECPTGTSLGRP
jgi:hypothetical protein